MLTNPSKGRETTVHGYDPSLSVLQCRVGVSQSQLGYVEPALLLCLYLSVPLHDSFSFSVSSDQLNHAQEQVFVYLSRVPFPGGGGHSL